MEFEAAIDEVPPNLRVLMRSLREGAEAAESKVQDLTHQLQTQEQIATVLMKEIGRLTVQLAKATSRPAQLALELELTKLQHRLDDLNNDKFGRRSERRGRPENDEVKPKKPRRKKRRSGRTPQPELPRDEQLHLLDEPDQRCKVCPGHLRPIDGCTGDDEVITVVERTFKITLHKQQVYKCPRCGDTDMALGPTKLSPKARYSPEFAVTVATDKYRDHRVPRRYAQPPQGRRSKSCCMKDEGRPLGIGVQAQVSNHPELLGSRARVVSVGGKGAARPRQVRSKKTSESEPLMTCREVFTRHRNRAGWLARDEPRGCLFTGWAVSGMKAA